MIVIKTKASKRKKPDELRREVMTMTGNSPAKANKDTKDRYVKLMHALRWMQIEVKTKEKGKGFIRTLPLKLLSIRSLSSSLALFDRDTQTLRNLSRKT